MYRTGLARKKKSFMILNNSLGKKKDEKIAIKKTTINGNISFISVLEYLKFKLYKTKIVTKESKTILNSIDEINGGAISKTPIIYLYSVSFFNSINLG